MSTDYIRYDILAQNALRGVVRTVMAEAAKKGLAGDHHFKISFDTTAAGVKLSPRMRAQYPQEMTIVLQHQFWDLEVSDEAFEVGLSFSGVPERLRVPFDAINGFFDPSVEFGLQFSTVVEEDNDDTEGSPEAHNTQTQAAPAKLESVKQEPVKLERKSPAKPLAAVPAPPPADENPDGDGDKPPKGGKTSGAEVVSLDRFRKK
jgi:hypothetical protein